MGSKHAQKECKPEAVDDSKDSVFRRQQDSGTNKLKSGCDSSYVTCVNPSQTKSHHGGGGYCHEIPSIAAELLATISYREKEDQFS